MPQDKYVSKNVSIFLFGCSICFVLAVGDQQVLNIIAESIKKSVFKDCIAPNITCGKSTCYGSSCGKNNDSFYVGVSNGAVTTLF